MGLGLAALGRPGYINIGHGDDVGGDSNPAAMRARAHRVLDAAYAAGVRYFDAARSYGLAEEFLGSWLEARSIDPNDVIIASKWGYTYTAAWRVDAATHEVKDHSIDVFRRQLAESRSALGPHLDLYQIHSATLESGVLDDTEVVDALAAAKAEGLRIGMSVSGPRQADTIWRALEIRRDGSRVFDAVQATWNLLERAAEPALRAAHAEGVSVIVKEAVANGRLTGRGIGPVSSAFAVPITSEAERVGSSIDALAIAFVVAQPWVDVVLSGATTVAQLESNLGALEVTMPPESIQRLAAVVMDSAAYWNARSALPWN
ncbi:MAG: NADP-dependent oxidoreductase domain protein [Geminicoccaceae bacterium]|jgi:aryl-alcohol dehydrogenase-like predicted oxidoreductase|nr:NADP-dependent oxidoreductase domain protein [Geminicoccaceae bacterium]